MTHARATSLAAALLPNALGSFATKAILVIAGSLALAVSAKVQVPGPVPMTLQSLVVLMIGAAFGARLGAATLLLYLAEGAAGLPVFAGTPEKGIGLAYMMGPTGGYLAGFVVAAYVVGWFAERGWDRSPLKLLVAMGIGHAAIFLFGYIWLASLIGVNKAWLLGVAPFMAATLIKTALGALLLPAIWRLISPRT